MPLLVRVESLTSQRMALPNDNRRADAQRQRRDPQEITAPGAEVSGRDNVIGFLAVFQEAFPHGPELDRRRGCPAAGMGLPLTRFAGRKIEIFGCAGVLARDLQGGTLAKYRVPEHAG